MKNLVLLAVLALIPVLGAQAQSNTVLDSIYIANVTNTVVTDATSVLVVPIDYQRASLLFQNRGSQSIQIKPNSPIVSATDGIVILACCAAGSRYEPVWAPVNKFYAKSLSGTQDLIIFTGRGPRSRR